MADINHKLDNKIKSEKPKWEEGLGTQLIKEARINITAGCAEWRDIVIKYIKKGNEWMPPEYYYDTMMGMIKVDDNMRLIGNHNDEFAFVHKDYELEMEEGWIHYQYFDFDDDNY